MKTLLLLGALALGSAGMVQAAPATANNAKRPMCSKTVTKHCTHPTKQSAEKVSHQAPATHTPATKTPTGK